MQTGKSRVKRQTAAMNTETPRVRGKKRNTEHLSTAYHGPKRM